MTPRSRQGSTVQGFRVHWWYMTTECCTRTAKYILMTPERCTGFPCTLMVHRGTQNTARTAKYTTRTAKYILMTAERSTLFCEPFMVFTGTHVPCSVFCGKRRALILIHGILFWYLKLVPFPVDPCKNRWKSTKIPHFPLRTVEGILVWKKPLIGPN